MVIAPITHISLDERGIAFISGTAIKVADIVIDAYTWNLAPLQIQANYPQISLAEIHAALAYYHDHREVIDRQIDAADQQHDQARESNPNALAREDFERQLSQSDTPDK